MNKTLNKAQYTILAMVVTIAALVSVWFIDSPIFGTVSAVLFLYVHGPVFGRFFFPKESKMWHIFWGVWFIFLCTIVFLTGIYWVHAYTSVWATMLLFFLCTLACFLYDKQRKENNNAAEIPSDLKETMFIKVSILAILGSEVLLFLILILRRSGDTIISPWTQVGPRFWILFFLVIVILFATLQQAYSKKIRLGLLLLHYTLVFSVAAIVYKHGFGFDLVIHEITEQWILTHGFILPKQPYYLGQYMLVNFLTSLTHLPLALINTWLVPILASASLPACFYFAFSKREDKSTLFPALLMLLFLPFSFFIQTTPHTLTLLFASILSLLLWYEVVQINPSKYLRIFGFLLASAACLIHPLIGLPAFIIYILFPFATKQSSTFFLSPKQWRVLLSIILIINLPGIFYLNALRSGLSLTFLNPFSHLDQLITIFETPHWYLFQGAPLFWQILYYYKALIIPLVALLGFIGVWKEYKKNPLFVRYWLAVFIGLGLAGVVLATAIRFPDVIGYEQHVYAGRMFTLILIFLLPFFLNALVTILQWVKKNRIRTICTPVVATLLLTVSWYFMYPTRDAVSKYTGYSIRDADIAAVNFIAERNSTSTKYIVLSNQTVAIAALRQFSFHNYYPTPDGGEQFFYSIPTGAPLYQFFRKMVYEEPKRQWMIEAMDYMGVDRAYFIHTNYWYPAAEIRDKAKAEADAWWDIGGGRVWVYEYTRRAEEKKLEIRK